jgi:pimeloyl-ACP methyl ester carboxylesterase
MFRFIDRHKDKTLAVVPGWAFDDQIFAEMELPYNYYIFEGPSVSSLTDDVANLLSSLEVEKVSLLGWSKGAFAVCELADRHPEWVDELLLVGARRRYQTEEVKTMRKNLLKNKIACLKRFYRRCFAKEEMERYQWFKTTLLERYLATMSTGQLTDELDWLDRVEIRPGDLQKIEKVRFIHGTADAIAPVEEAQELADGLPQSQLVLFEQTGHIPFLREDFQRCVYGH